MRARNAELEDFHPTPGRSAGFTLIEVMVSTTILILLTLILSQALNHLGGIWQLSRARVEKSEGGRAVLEFMTRELAATQLPVNRTDQKSLQFLVNPQSSVSSKYLNRDAVFWQAPVASDQSLGDLAEIGYFVQWDETTNPANPRAVLCRLFVNPNDPNSISDPNPNYLIYSGLSWITDTIIGVVAPADNSNKQNPYQGLFVENVLALWVTCLDPTGKAISGNTFDSRTGYSYTDLTGSSVTLSGCALPAAIDLSFVMLDSHSANRITPELEREIKQVAAQASDANDFVIRAREDPILKQISSALSPCKTRVYLQNSK